MSEPNVSGERGTPRTGLTPCDWPECEHSIVNGWALFRVNPTGQKGIFMCSEHAGASPEEVADLMDAVASHMGRSQPSTETVSGSLTDRFAEDIAVWARVYADWGWTKDTPAVRNLAQRLTRVAIDLGGDHG